MDLILWRHADAGEHVDSEHDLERRLTAKGERQAQRMAHRLNQLLPAATRVLASPAARTEQTAQALDRKFKTVAALAPAGSVDDLLAAVRWPDGRDTVLVVGHQPTLGFVAARLMAGSDQPWTIRKGAAWWLRCRAREGVAQTVLVCALSPETV
jgi:phosphohistidine phosphatase